MIYPITAKAKVWFEKDVAPWDTRLDTKIRRLQFLDSVLELLPRKVVKEDLIFCEKEPIWEDIDFNGCHNPKKEFETIKDAWQQRKENFEPMFIGEWEEFKNNYWTNDMKACVTKGMTIEEALQGGCKLNPNHKDYPKYWKQVNEVEL